MLRKNPTEPTGVCAGSGEGMKRPGKQTTPIPEGKKQHIADL